MYLKIQCKVSLFLSTVGVAAIMFLSLMFPVIDAQWDIVLRWPCGLRLVFSLRRVQVHWEEQRRWLVEPWKQPFCWGHVLLRSMLRPSWWSYVDERAWSSDRFAWIAGHTLDTQTSSHQCVCAGVWIVHLNEQIFYHNLPSDNWKVSHLLKKQNT